jgi:proteic killer suppression protein
MIKSFKDRRTEHLFNGIKAPGLPEDIQRAGMRKLKLLHNAVNLHDVRVPPGNRLEALKGDRAGQYSIRVNDQWRICFVWRDGHAFFVELVDYH